MSDQRNWEPTPAERIWYSHILTGDRGYFIRRDGKDCIRLDRPTDPYAVKQLTADWQKDETWRPITQAQRAQVAFEADRALARALGLHKESERSWINLKDEERIAWVNNGPMRKERDPRQKLWEAIMEATKELAR